MTVPFYRAYEDRYRGSRELIKSRLRVYEPFLVSLPPRAVALDLGCGRGEWLELLGELNFDARGVDLDEGMLAACHERGLNVTLGDALAFLRACPDASLSLVSAFHLVEHIPFDAVSDLIAQALRALRPGGLLIMETPNSENLVVGASTFYSDPSHLRPLPPTLLSFATEHAGFMRQHVLRLQEAPQLHDAVQLTLFDVLGGASPDYSVVAQKAAPAPQMAPFDQAFGAAYGIDLHTLAQRYDEANKAEQWHTASALARFEQRATAELNQLTSAFTQLSEAVNHGAATTDGVARQLQNSLAVEAERAGAFAHERAVALANEQAAALANEQALALVHEQVAALVHEQAAALDAKCATAIGAMAATVTRLNDERTLLAGQVQHAIDDMAIRTAQAEANAARLGEMLLSRSWRMTAPLRMIGGQAARFGFTVRRARRPDLVDLPAPQASLAARLRIILRKVVRVTLRRTGLKQAVLRMLQHFPRLRARIYRAMYQSEDAAQLDIAGPELVMEENTGDLSPKALRVYRKLKRAQVRKEPH